jgi:hypothetical protein
VADDNGAADPHAAEGIGDKPRLAIGRGIYPAVRTIAPAMARAIDQNDVVPAGQTFAEGKPHVAEIRTRPVEKNDDRRVGRTHVDKMKSAAFDIDELPGWRIFLFNPLDTKRGVDSSRAEHGKRGGQSQDSSELPPCHAVYGYL